MSILTAMASQKTQGPQNQIWVYLATYSDDPGADFYIQDSDASTVQECLASLNHQLNPNDRIMGQTAAVFNAWGEYVLFEVDFE